MHSGFKWHRNINAIIISDNNLEQAAKDKLKQAMEEGNLERATPAELVL